MATYQRMQENILRELAETGGLRPGWLGRAMVRELVPELDFDPSAPPVHWRYWALRSNSAHGPHLASPFTGTPQLTAEQYAECNSFATSPIKALLAISGRGVTLDPVPAEPPPHPYPHICGVAATRDRAGIMWCLRDAPAVLPAFRMCLAGQHDGFAVGPVDLFGGVLPGHRGPQMPDWIREARASGYHLRGPLEVPPSRAAWIPDLEARYGVPFVVSAELEEFTPGLTAGPCVAAGLVIVRGQKVLLAQRSRFVDHPGTWAFPGGTAGFGETATAAALREAREEIGIGSDDLRVLREVVGLERYTYVVARLTNRRLPTLVLNWEHDAVEWVPIGNVADRPLHPGLAATWNALREAL